MSRFVNSPDWGPGVECAEKDLPGNRKGTLRTVFLATEAGWLVWV